MVLLYAETGVPIAKGTQANQSFDEHTQPLKGFKPRPALPPTKKRGLVQVIHS
jgi:hypothetical protein